jgi:hypothetical protein
MYQTGLIGRVHSVNRTPNGGHVLTDARAFLAHRTAPQVERIFERPQRELLIVGCTGEFIFRPLEGLP